MKSYSFAVVVTNRSPVPAEVIEEALDSYFYDDSNYWEFGDATIKVESLGQVNLLETGDTACA